MAVTSLPSAGSNVQELLNEVALGTRSMLLEHFKRFIINGPGGLMVTKDMTQYTDVLKSWNIDDDIKGAGGALDGLLEVGNLFVIGPEALRERIRAGATAASGKGSRSNTAAGSKPGLAGQANAGLSVAEVRAYVSRREDSNTPAMQSVLTSL